MARATGRPGDRPPSAAVLVESKLAPPQLSLRLLARSALSARLHAGLTQRVVSVTAPAGYGKTTALAQFVAQLEPHGITCGWLNTGDLGRHDARATSGSPAAPRT